MEVSKVKVEPILDYFDREYAEDLLSREHPLGARKLRGHRLVYRAMYRGQWVGVLTFDQSVFRNKHREARIGWSDGQRQERLKHVINNSRYLILPECSGVPNLASKVLSLATSRLSSDWERQYGYPILAVETYVDPARRNNQGTCYTAAGWENLGLSSGYERPGEDRTSGKWYFLKALHPESYAALRAEIPHALITGIKPVSGGSNNNYVLDASKFDLKGLKAALAKIPDHRSRHGRRYEFLPLLSLCVAAVLSGYTQYRQITDWIRSLPGGLRVRFGLPGDLTPSESTITKFLSRINAEQLQAALSGWLLEKYGKELESLVLSMDGKAIRATGADAGKQVKFLNVLAQDLGIVLEQKPTKGGGGENITAQKVVKDSALLQNATVIADAIHTEKKFIAALEKKTVRTCSLSKIIRAG